MNQNLNDNDKPVLILQYRAIQSRSLIDSLMMFFFGTIILALAFIIPIKTWTFDPIIFFGLCFFGSIFIFMGSVWFPYRNCNIILYKTHFTFNPATNTPFFNPTIQSKYVEVEHIEFQNNAKQMRVTLTNKNKEWIILRGLNEKKIQILINMLISKGLEVKIT